MGSLSEKMTKVHKHAFCDSFSQRQMVLFIWTFQKHSACEVSSLMWCHKLGTISLLIQRCGVEQKNYQLLHPWFR